MGRFINGDGYADTGMGLTSTNMFSYCGNNPIVRADPTGEFWGIVALVATAIVATVAVVTHICTVQSNYSNNLTMDCNKNTSTVNKFVNDQNGETGKNFKYGFYDAKHNACETIAVHNAKLLKGMDSCLSETIKDFQVSNAMIGYGYFGSNPFSIGRVLDKYGIDHINVGLAEMNAPGIYIISYWNTDSISDGLHTVAVRYDSGTYTTYNLSGLGNVSDRLPSIYAKKYVCGYYLR